MGYLVGKFTTEALLRMGEGAEYTVETVNDAIYALTGAESDMLCKPWYFTQRHRPDGNVSNNTDRTVVAARRQHGRSSRTASRSRAPTNNPLDADPRGRSGDAAR